MRGSQARKPLTSVQFSYRSALTARATTEPLMSLPPREKVLTLPVAAHQRRGYGGVGALFVERALFVEKDDVFCVHELSAEFRRDDARVEIFAAGSREVGALVLLYVALGFVEDGVDVESVHAEFVHDGAETPAHGGKCLRATALLLRFAVAGIEHIRNFRIPGIALSGGGHHHIFAGGVGVHDGADALYVVAVRQRRTAEFADSKAHFFISLPSM